MSKLSEWALNATPEEINKANWKVIYQGLLRAQHELEKTSVVHSWLYPYLHIAKQESEKSSE